MGGPQMLPSLPDDAAKRQFAGLYRAGKIKTGDELAAAIRAAKNGQAAGGRASFACEEIGVKIAVSWTSVASGGKSCCAFADPVIPWRVAGTTRHDRLGS
jgi:hypothetical protein